MKGLKFNIRELAAAFSRLSKREKIMLGVAAGCFVVFLGILFSMIVGSKLDAMRRRVDDTTDKLQQMLGLRQEYEQAKKSRRQSEQRIKAARNIQLMGMLENLAKQVGIDTKEIEMNPRSSATNPETNIEEERVEVKIEKITIDSLVEFLQRIESRSDTIAVRSLHVKHNFREPKFLSVDFTVSKFQLREQSEKHGKGKKG